jgi:hypothetical protein
VHPAIPVPRTRSPITTREKTVFGILENGTDMIKKFPGASLRKCFLFPLPHAPSPARDAPSLISDSPVCHRNQKPQTPVAAESRPRPVFKKKPFSITRAPVPPGDPAGGTNLFLEKNRTTSPDSPGALVIRSVFRSNRFIIKGYSLSKSTLLVKGPGDAVKKKR